MMLVSVVIPVYNVESYLRCCVDSVISQTYQNIEVILVDDGSPDNSGKICDEYASKDKRISAIHKVNGGLSDARNVGLAMAKGDYVMFVDSDDFWRDSTCMERLVAKLESFDCPDFMGFNICYYYPSSDRYVPWVAYGNSIVNETDKEKIICELVKSGTFPMSACCKLLRRKFLIDNSILFIEGIYSEDIPWFVELLEKAESVRFVNDYVYCYTKEVSSSITRTMNPKKFSDALDNINRVLDVVRRASFGEEVRHALLSFCAYNFCILMGAFRLLDPVVAKEKESELRKYGWLMAYTMNPKVRKVRWLYRFMGFDLTSYACYRYIRRIL